VSSTHFPAERAAIQAASRIAQRGRLAANDLREINVGAHGPASGGASNLPESVRGVVSTNGTQLGSSEKRFFEPLFSHDFSRVRIHSDSAAAESARLNGALAYTVGNHVVFGANQYSNNNLTHELAHVVQQNVTAAEVLQKLADPECGTTTPLPLHGSCRSGFVHTCYSETFVPASASALHVEVTVSGGIPGQEDFSVQVFKCGTIWDTHIGAKRISKSMPDTLRFDIASVTAGDKYYIKIYSRSHEPLDASYNISQ